MSHITEEILCNDPPRYHTSHINVFDGIFLYKSIDFIANFNGISTLLGLRTAKGL